MTNKEIISRSRVLSMPRLVSSSCRPPTHAHSSPRCPTTRLNLSLSLSLSLSLMLSLHAAHEGLLVANLLASGDDHKVGAAALDARELRLVPGMSSTIGPSKAHSVRKVSNCMLWFDSIACLALIGSLQCVLATLHGSYGFNYYSRGLTLHPLLATLSSRDCN